MTARCTIGALTFTASLPLETGNVSVTVDSEGSKFIAGRIMLTADEWQSLLAASASLSAARRAEDDRREVERLTRERDEARRHLDERIQWQLEAVLNLQTFRALYDAAIAVREAFDGCSGCGECVRCKFDKAVDQAKVEVAAGVDEFIAESAGFWGRFAAQMQKERDQAVRQCDALTSAAGKDASAVICGLKATIKMQGEFIDKQQIAIADYSRALAAREEVKRG